MRKLLQLPLALGLLLNTACRKEIEKIVVQVQEVDKQYSWSANKATLYGNFSILLGSGKGPGGLYFQQPGGFAALTGTPTSRLSLTQYLFGGTTDITVRNPIGRDFFVTYYDSLVHIVPNTHPVMSGAGCFIRLKKLDPQALRVQPNRFTFNKLAAISANNYVLIPYETTRQDFKNRLVLAHITPASSPYYPVYAAQTQLIELPITSGIYPYMPTLLMAFDDYFLVDCGSEGVYKITESGLARQVMPAYTGVNTFFRSKGVLYATLDGQRLAMSTTNGDTWQITSGGPSMLYTTIHPVGDSLVGVSHALGGSLFAFHLDMVKRTWRIRPLKDDGLNHAAINGLETWNDTVYLATSSGLFKRPLNKLFESKP
jgi:hypothetical protein